MQGLLTPSTEAACPCCEEGPPPPHAHTCTGGRSSGLRGGREVGQDPESDSGKPARGPSIPGPVRGDGGAAVGQVMSSQILIPWPDIKRTKVLN